MSEVGRRGTEDGGLKMEDGKLIIDNENYLCLMSYDI
jgi:hypothetical protein